MTGLLRRDLRRIDVVALTANVMIASGIFAMPGTLSRLAGHYSVAVLIAAFAMVALLALSLVEVSSRYAVTGGAQVYAGDAFGPLAGFSIGWLMALSRAASFGAIARVMLDYLGQLWAPLGRQGLQVIALTVFALTLILANVRGVTRGAQLGNLFTVAKILPLALLALVGTGFAGWNHLPAAAPKEFGALTQALLIALFACFGFEQAAIVTGEMRDPKRDLASGILVGLGIAGLLYLLLLLACFALVPDMQRSTLPLVDAAIALLGPLGGKLMAVAAVMSCGGALAGLMLVSPRVLFALAESGDMPHALSAVHPRYHTPHVAIWVMGIAVWLLAISGTFIYLATIVVVARILTYASTSAALIVLRRRGPSPFPIPGGPIIAVLALVCTLGILATTSLVALRDVAIALLAGLVLRAFLRRSR